MVRHRNPGQVKHGRGKDQNQDDPALAAAVMVAAVVVAYDRPGPARADDEIPVAEFGAPPPSDGAEAARREARNKWFDYGQVPLGEKGPRVTTFYSYSPGHVRDLPIHSSSTVLIGRVQSARAFVSARATRVYSEFRVAVTEVLADSFVDEARAPVLAAGDLIDVLRQGGGVRFPSGALVLTDVNGLHLPHGDRVYLLFLSRKPALDAFHLDTAYDVTDAKVTSLDTPWHYPAFDNLETPDFVAMVRTRLAERVKQ